MERDKAAEGEERVTNFPFFPRRDTRRAYSFITYSVPIARLEIMRYIRTKGTRGGERATLIQGSM